MKIAVTARGKDLDSSVDPRFGRAAYIIVVDTANENIAVLDNTENANAFKGAGIQAAAMVGDSGADVLLTGFCGPNAYKTLAAAGVRVVSDVGGTARNALEALKKGEMSFVNGANVDRHW